MYFQNFHPLQRAAAALFLIALLAATRGALARPAQAQPNGAGTPAAQAQGPSTGGTPAPRADTGERPAPPPSAWPQAYQVEQDKAGGLLTLRTPYYTFTHDLKRGGAIASIALAHGRASNLLARPLETRVRDEHGVALSDLKDPKPTVTRRAAGLNAIVSVECALADEQGRASALRLKTVFEYHWGFVRIHKEFVAPPDGLRAREVCPLATVLAPSLCEYGYREGLTEEEGAPPFSFGSNLWGKLRAGQSGDRPLETRYVPRSMLFANPGVEGLEWFAASDLWQWDLQLTGRRGQGQCSLRPSQQPPGLALSLAPWSSADASITLTNTSVFDFYLAVPILEGRPRAPWLHTSFNRNRGNWVSAEEIRRWAQAGFQTVHCHNDGDYYDDGLFWRDGSYPPYPDMERYDQVLRECRRAGIRTATYFSNKELHPSTKEFQEHGQEWGRQNRKGELQHNFFRAQSEFGAQMCLRSGWLDFLKSSIDRVLRNHPLDGVYYDWNVALLCCNARHELAHGANAPGRGHWDIDELLALMEWTRQRVGPNGLIIVHNTTVPMFATENFANDVVATEWGYQKWTDRAPDLADLPLEWSLVGARSRGVISYGTIDSNAPRRLHRLFALEALLAGVAPWPASPETLDLLPLLKPVGDFTSCRFADWRNQAVTLSDPRCAAAVYSRPREAFLFLANLEPAPREVTCLLRPEALPYPLPPLSAATQLGGGAPAVAGPDVKAASSLDIRQLTSQGLKLTLPGDGAILIHVR